MKKWITTKTTTYVFYSGITIWIIALIVGALFHLPYVEKTYRSVTPFLFVGGLISILAICNLASGRAWRGHHRVASRLYEPIAYWTITVVMGIIGIAFLVLGVISLHRLNP